MNSKPSFYKPELDVIRFIAFLLVFLHHVFPNDQDWYIGRVPAIYAKILTIIVHSFESGLSLFFFLSAYLIATLLMIEYKDFGSIDLKSFYIRRILRIWPLYFAGILVGVMWAWYFHRLDQISIFKWFIFFIGNFYYQHHPWNGSPMEPLWSISVEEQFYVIFPLLIGILGTVCIPQLGIGFMVVSIVALFAECSNHASDTAIWTNTLSQFIFFGVGIICAAFTAKYEIKLKPLIRIFFIVTAFVLFFSSSFFTFDTQNMLTIAGYVGVSIGCALVLFSFLNTQVKFPKFILYLGKISYGLYVWHMLNFYIYDHFYLRSFFSHGLLLKLLTLFPTIGMAVLSYRYLETPFLRLKSKFTYIRNRPIV
jgi:peptidoglycan/LPS O-acetylase OafA/YrhL